ncbi:hypothetical protein [Polyangium mundeleinium]|uniref:Cell division protein ZapA n=1 Tax=Polyangium mundeleinium TaxID=2995306 RepID=A0ABT5EL74_9BACT|nr:hypothetical protein [Polyangium mundeleinium]MDC0741490.1 hypothetical protein [Polyangium mundeleinium]
MASSDDDDDRTIGSGITFAVDPTREIASVFDDLEDLLKNGDVIESLSQKGVNASIALTAIEGLRAYLEGKKAEAAEDFAMVAEEIRGRLELARAAEGPKNGHGGHA